MVHPAENTIPSEECWELLRRGWFGRLGLSVDALPAILPVEYAIVEGDIAVCLGQYRLRPRSLNDAVVAFAADFVDAETHSGWTVQVQGRGRLPQGGVTTECGLHQAGQIMYITPETLDGQTLHLCPFGTGLPRRDSV